MTSDQSWIQRIPKTELTWIFAWLIAFAVVGRYVWTGDAPDGTVLAFSSALIVTAAGLHVGMRATAKPEVIVAEAQAKAIERTAEQPVAEPTVAADVTTEPVSARPPELTERVPDEEVP